MNIIAWLGVALSVFIAGFGVGIESMRLHYRPIIADMKLKAEDAVIKQQDENSKIVAKHDADALVFSQDFINHIAKLERDNNAKTSVASHIACSLQQPAASISSVPTTSAASGIPDAAPADALVVGLPEACAVTTQQLVDLQDWVRKVSTP